MTQLEDVTELMQHIQSRLSVEEAARTSVLSKSWLRSWTTTPTLRFCVPKEQEDRKQMKLVDIERTLNRYLHDNIPIERFELMIHIENQESSSLVERLIRRVATKTCVKELSFTIRLEGASLHFPHEIFLGENLTKIKVSASSDFHSAWMTTSHHPKCVSLRELHLSGVHISEEVLNNILSSCSMLVNIELLECSRDLMTIKVNNLPCLYQLHVATVDGSSTSFDINHVPNLRLLTCNVDMLRRSKRPLINAHSISLGTNVRDLNLSGGVITDNASLDVISNLGLPFLESLNLDMACWTLGSFHFTCASIKRFSLLGCPRRLANVVHVNAPKLLFFSFSGKIMPSLLFPDSTLEQIEFRLRLRISRLNASFFLKMREALILSSKCRVHITTTFDNHDPLQLDIEIDNLRRRLHFPPAMNVQHLSFRTNEDECLWERSPFFDAFFEICHPRKVVARRDLLFQHNNHFCKLMLKEVLEKSKYNTTTMTCWPHYLKYVQISRTRHKKWETLTASHKSFLDGPATHVPIKFKLYWH